MSVPTTTHRIVAIAGLALAGALTACSSPSAADENAPEAEAPADEAASGDTTGDYADGSYEAEGEYQSPAGPETIGVTVTLEGGIVTAVEVEPRATNPNSVRFQGQLAEGIGAVVLGQNIDELDVDRVAGSSLTSGGFAEAIERIKVDAAD